VNSGVLAFILQEQAEARADGERKVMFWFGFLRQGLTVYPPLILNSQSSCLNLSSAGITGVGHHSQQKRKVVDVTCQLPSSSNKQQQILVTSMAPHV
jgi:hypothetical protein